MLLKDSFRTGSHDAAARAEIAFLEQGLKNAQTSGPLASQDVQFSGVLVEQEPSGSQQLEYLMLIFSLQLLRGSLAISGT